MTLTGRKFSSKKRSMTLHDIGYILGRTGWLFPVGFVAYTILIPFLTAGLPGNSIFDIEVTHNQLKFRLINPDAIEAVIAASIVLGLITGLSMFGFLRDKRETTIFLSLGITRTRLFTNRVFVSFAMLAVMAAVPMAVSVALNVSALGEYQALIRNAVFLWLGIFLMAAVSCAIATGACLMAGSLMEAIVYWGSVIALPTILCFGLNSLMKVLYWGNAWGVTAYSGTEQIRESLVEEYAPLNPVLFFRNEMEIHGQFMRPLTTDVPEDVSWMVIVAWAAVLAVATVADWMLFRRWKAENVGITGNGKLMAEITAGITGFILFALAVAYLADFGVISAMIPGVLVFIGAHLFWKKAGILGRIKLREQMLCAGIQMTVIAAMCIVFVTGFFNGTERYLEKGEITEATVNYVGDPSFYSGEASGSSTGRGYYVAGHIRLDDDESVKKAKELHMMFEKSGRQPMKASDNVKNTVVPYDISFSYTGSDGEEHIWYYDRASYGQLEKLLSMEELTEVKEQQSRLFAGETDDGKENSMAKTAYDMGTVFITDEYLSQTYELTLGNDMRYQLLGAIGRDFENMTAAERYFPEEKAKAVLMFSLTGDEDSKYFSYHLNNTFIYLTSDYENTLNWLKKNDLLDYVSDDREIESITLQRMDPYIGINTPDYPMGMYFMSYRADSADEFMIQKDFGNSYVVTDKDEIEVMATGLRNGWYMSGGGYMAAVKIAGSDRYTYMFLPEVEIPSFIRK